MRKYFEAQSKFKLETAKKPFKKFTKLFSEIFNGSDFKTNYKEESLTIF